MRSAGGRPHDEGENRAMAGIPAMEDKITLTHTPKDATGCTGRHIAMRLLEKGCHVQ